MTPAPRYCRSCGKPLVAGAAFCRACGARVPGSVAEPESPPPDRPAAPPDRADSPPAQSPPRPTPPAAAPAPPPAAPTPPPAQRPPAPPTPPPPGEPAPKPRRRGRIALLAALALLVVGGGAAAAIVLLGGEDSKQAETSTGEASTVPETTTVPTRTGEAGPAGAASTAPTAGTIGAGRYAQAGSFRTVPGAEAERQRLEEDGIRVMVVESDQAQELYPGFQVLLGGPFTSGAEERAMVRRLHGAAIPSAFGRALSPAAEIAGPEAIAGEWEGTLDRSGSDRASEDGPLPVTLTAAADGQTATLDFTSLNCEVGLALRDESEVSLTYGQEGGCVGGGSWRLRPSGEELSLVLLPPGSETIVLGVLDLR